MTGEFKDGLRIFLFPSYLFRLTTDVLLLLGLYASLREILISLPSEKARRPFLAPRWYAIIITAPTQEKCS